jgi:hypothetical protein
MSASSIISVLTILSQDVGTNVVIVSVSMEFDFEDVSMLPVSLGRFPCNNFLVVG